jgi:Kef-type K+ transport system membrane component KefB
MHDSALFLSTIGGLLLIGLFASALAKKTFLPRVTILLIFGAFIGQSGINLIPESFTQHFSLIADMTLLMVGFLLGGKITKRSLKGSAKESLLISISAALLTATIVAFGLWAMGMPADMAILLGCIASATDAAAIMDVINELGIDTKFSRLLMSIVALDDIWALMLFAIGMAAVSSTGVEAGGQESILLTAAFEIFGSVILGLVLGIPAAYITGRVKAGQPILTEAIAMVFICGGLSMWLELSYLITSMVMGAVIANLARHHEYPFHAIENIENPFMVVFFIMAGASLDLQSILGIGLFGLAFIALRILGKLVGAKVGGLASGSSADSSKWLGPALFPQAGVAIGMALVASHHLGASGQMLLTIAVSSTMFFEIVGPVFTHIAIKRVG